MSDERTSKRGFAAMDEEKQREIASMGGKVFKEKSREQRLLDLAKVDIEKLQAGVGELERNESRADKLGKVALIGASLAAGGIAANERISTITGVVIAIAAESARLFLGRFKSRNNGGPDRI